MLGPELVDKVVVLRMSQGFIELMRREYPQALTLNYPKVVSILSPKDNAEDPQPSDKAALRDCDMEFKCKNPQTTCASNKPNYRTAKTLQKNPV